MKKDLLLVRFDGILCQCNVHELVIHSILYLLNVQAFVKKAFILYHAVLAMTVDISGGCVCSCYPNFVLSVAYAHCSAAPQSVHGSTWLILVVNGGMV